MFATSFASTGACRLVVTGTLLLLSMGTHACPDPDRPLVETEELVQRLNRYAPGSVVCILSSQYCVDCTPGFLHECQKVGTWRKVERCDAMSLKQASLRASRRNQDGGGPTDSDALAAVNSQLGEIGQRQESTSAAEDRQSGVDRADRSPGSCERYNSSLLPRLRLTSSRVTVDYVATAIAQGAARVAQLADAQVADVQAKIAAW